MQSKVTGKEFSRHLCNTVTLLRTNFYLCISLRNQRANILRMRKPFFKTFLRVLQDVTKRYEVLHGVTNCYIVLEGVTLCYTV